MKRTRLAPMSAKRIDAIEAHKSVREAVFKRDGGCLAQGVWGPCFGPMTPHHLLKASQGGAYSMDNLITLCAHHNGLLEADARVAREAEELGLVQRRYPR